MTAESTLVSIGIPTRNRSALLQRAVDSVLAQTWPNIELIISDNASTDGTKDMLAALDSYRVKRVFQAGDIGMVPNWNACLTAASGDYFLLLSDDDFLAKDAVERLIRCAATAGPAGLTDRAAEGPELIVGLVDRHETLVGQTFDARRSHLLESGLCDGTALFQETIRLDSLISVMFCGCLFPRKKLLRIGGFPLDFPFCADVIPLMHLMIGQRVVFLNESCATYTVHRGSATLTTDLDTVLSDQVRRCEFARMRVRSTESDNQVKRACLDAIDSFESRELQSMLIHHLRSGAPRRRVLRATWSWRKYTVGRRPPLLLIAYIGLPAGLLRILRGLRKPLKKLISTFRRAAGA